MFSITISANIYFTLYHIAKFFISKMLAHQRLGLQQSQFK
jgi:hypothetical protein